MRFRDQIHDALKFTLMDWKAIVILGIILCIAATFDELDSENLILITGILIISTLLIFFEEGYRYRIIEDTLAGHNKPPIIRNIKTFLNEGFYETVTMAVYFAAITILANYLNKMPITGIFFYEYIILYIVFLFVYIIFFGAAINKALHDGKFLSGFNVFEIIGFYREIGIKKSLLLILIEAIFVNFLVSSVFDWGVLNGRHTLEFIICFFLSPILLLFSTRLMASFGREVNSD